MVEPPRRLIVVSNRLPVVLQKTDGSWKLRPGSGGLVTALAPVLSHRGGLWIGWPGLEVDPEGEWRDLMSSGFRERGYDLFPVVLTRKEVKGFYRGFSNAVLWPLFHDMVGSCDFAPEFWYAYLDVNRKFAEAVEVNAGADDFVWVQDYQLIHVAEFVRERDPHRTIGFFLHIPFPPLDILVKLPWRGQILGALLAYDLLGFQTQRDMRNFLSCLQNLLPEVEISGDGPVVDVRVGGRRVRVGEFPIGIDYEHFHQAALSADVEERIKDLRRKIGPYKVVLGVDRLDYTKGLMERLQAYRNALERFPDLHGEVILFQLVVPSREQVPEYAALKAQIDQLVGEINGQFSTAGWVPVHYHYRSIPQEDLIALYRLAQVGFVTSLKDGMNLVAKEYCACQARGTGVLILSEFAGAAAQLKSGALLVNPHDIEGMADALHQAFELDIEEREQRMESMQKVLREQDIFWWVENYLKVALGEGLGGFRTEEEYVPDLDLRDAWVDV